MNIRCLFVVSLALFLFPIKSVFAQTEKSKTKQDLAFTSTDPKVSIAKRSNFYPSLRSDNPQNVITPQSISATRSFYTEHDLSYKWYFQVGAGAQLLMAEDDDKVSLNKRITLAPSITAGFRWHPIFGARLNITGGSLHGFNDGILVHIVFGMGKVMRLNKHLPKNEV